MRFPEKLIDALATGMYLGRLPRMPGTFGTLLGLPVVAALALASPLGYMFGAVILLFVAVAVAERYERGTKAHDPQEVVIDEVVGYVIAMTWLPTTWQAYLAAFVLFRFFDILKPFPIGEIDRKIGGGLGTVLDDVAAGLAANVLLQVAYAQTDWLGVRLIHVGG